MKNFKSISIGIFCTFIIIHIVCMLATRIVGGGSGILVTIAEIIASILIYWTIKDDLKKSKEKV